MQLERIQKQIFTYQNLFLFEMTKKKMEISSRKINKNTILHISVAML